MQCSVNFRKELINKDLNNLEILKIPRVMDPSREVLEIHLPEPILKVARLIKATPVMLSNLTKIMKIILKVVISAKVIDLVNLEIILEDSIETIGNPKAIIKSSNKELMKNFK